MRHPHYQINIDGEDGNDLAALRKVVGQVKRARLVEILASHACYRDDNLWVTNNPDFSSIDMSLVRDMLVGQGRDPDRNNICRDLGFAGQRNSRRDPKYLGLSRANMMADTMSNWATGLFAGVTKAIDNNFPDLSGSVYNDPERNEIFAGEIHPENRVEALRLAKTNKAGMLLDIHCDNGNCETSGYAYVAGFAMHCKDKYNQQERFVLVTYGKKGSEIHMAERRKHRKAILFLSHVYDALPEKQKSQGSDVFPGRGAKRVDYPFTFLDKGIFYSLFASAIALVFEKYPGLKHDLLMMAAFLANVCMSECADHFWQILEELRSNPILISGIHIMSADPLDFGYKLMEEIFFRKRLVSLAYPVKKRHQPAVNKPPSREQMDNTIHSIALLIRELRGVSGDIDNVANAMNFYGKAVEFLVKEAYGAGHLTAQHTLGVAVCLKLMPPMLLAVAEVGLTTKSWFFFSWAFEYATTTAYHETNTLLRASSNYLHISVMRAEELICVATKAMAPTQKYMDENECEVDYEKCSIDLRANNQTGDVIYLDMRLYRLNQENELYCLTRDGVFSPAEEVMCDSLFDRATFKGNLNFWSRIRRKEGGDFHYQRKRSGKGCKSILEYFTDTACHGDEYVPTPSRSRGGAVDGREKIAYNLFGPSYQSVVTGFDGREPLSLAQIVWKALGGKKDFTKKMFRMQIHQLKLVRPPCVHPKYQVMSANQKFYSCCLVPQVEHCLVPLTDKLYWPDPNFPLMSCRGEEQGTVAPREWKRSVTFWGEEDYDKTHQQRWPNRIQGRDCPLDHSRRTEPFYVWNSNHLIPSAGSPFGRVMVFTDEERARKTAMAEFVFQQRQFLDLEAPQVQSLFFMPPNIRRGNRDCPFFEVKKKRKRIPLERTKEVHVYYNTQARRSRIERPAFLIAIKYPKGGCLYYFCDSGGRRLSAPLLQRPLPVATRLDRSRDTMHEFHCILSHVVKVNSTGAQRKNEIWVMLLWIDRSRSEELMESVFQTSPLEVVYYAEKRGLLDESGWSKVRSLSRSLHRSSEEEDSGRETALTIIPSSRRLHGRKSRSLRLLA